MTTLKRIDPQAIDVALDKADHYRLLNEPWHAESICLDVLEEDSENQRAVVTLLLSLTDQFSSMQQVAQERAESLISRLVTEYDQHYYRGIITERWAIAKSKHGSAPWAVSEWLGKAMLCYERAEKLSGNENPDSVLRWNACARLKEQFGERESSTRGLARDIQAEFGDDVPLT